MDKLENNESKSDFQETMVTVKWAFSNKPNEVPKYKLATENQSVIDDVSKVLTEADYEHRVTEAKKGGAAGYVAGGNMAATPYGSTKDKPATLSVDIPTMAQILEGNPGLASTVIGGPAKEGSERSAG